MLYHLSEIGYGFGVVARVDVVVGVGVVPFLACRPVDGVALHVPHHVFGVVEPTLLKVALGEPSPRLGVYGGLRLIQTTHVSECGGSLVKGALIELRPSHKHPSFPQERVILAA